MFSNRSFSSLVSQRASPLSRLLGFAQGGGFIPASLRMATTLPKLPIFEAIESHDPYSKAVIHSASGRSFTYGELLKDVAEAKDRLHEAAGCSSIAGERIAFLVENGYDYVGAQRP